MFKFLCSIRKETLILLRDKAGLIILFLMPMVLIIIMSLLQEVGYSSITRDSRVDVLFINQDQDTLGSRIRSGLENSGFFNLVDSLGGKPLTEQSVREAVRSGDYVIGMIIPRGITKKIRANVRIMVAKTLSGFGLANPAFFSDMKFRDADTLTLLFDPAVKKSFKNSIVSSVKQYSYRIESEMVFSTFNRELKRAFPAYDPPEMTYHEAFEFAEVFPSYHEVEQIPDTAQHNVPAWAVFAMFFIVIPLTSSMIVEREEGSMFRLKSMPVSYVQLLIAKVFVYMIVCFFQTVLMIASGIYILPLFGAQALSLGTEIPAMIVLTLVTSLAALGFGVLAGTVARTHQQAAAFGAVAIIIMAALGGLWVPMYLMAPVMQEVSAISPLNWALNGYYDIFVRGGGFTEILPELAKLMTFFTVMLLSTIIYWKIKNPFNR